jgi:hypothetical protein
MEQGGNNTGPIVDKIIRANGGVIGEPWCGDFVAYCYRLAGSKAVDRLWASVYFLGRSCRGCTVTSPRPAATSSATRSITPACSSVARRRDDRDRRGQHRPDRRRVSDGDGGDGVYRKRRSSVSYDYIRRCRDEQAVSVREGSRPRDHRARRGPRQWAASGQLNQPELVTAITGLVASVATYFVPNTPPGGPQ